MPWRVRESVQDQVGHDRPVVAAELEAGTSALGGEDLDIFLRLLTHRSAIVYEPGTILRHRHPRDFAGLRRQLHGYGVGLGAALTKCLADRPTRALDVAVRLRSGLAYLLRAASPKNQRKWSDSPESSRCSSCGVLARPGANLRSPREERRGRRMAPRIPSGEPNMDGAACGSVQTRKWLTSVRLGNLVVALGSPAASPPTARFTSTYISSVGMSSWERNRSTRLCTRRPPPGSSTARRCGTRP